MPNIRKANEDDSKDIFDWRNNELTRKMSHTTDLVAWDEHRDWFASSLTNPDRLLVMCEDAKLNKKIAIVRFDVKDERALISINLSPKMRGKGKAKECLRDAISFFRTLYSHVRFIDAEIKFVNIASQQSFLGAGFVFIREDSGVLFYECEIIYDRY